MIMVWLWNSMTPEISKPIMCLPTTNDIWDSIQEIHSKWKDAAQMYDLTVKTCTTK